jgi:hypothetical protein
MPPQEQKLFTGLFDRLRALPVSAKDAEAEALIGEAVRSVPDATVQSTLNQQQVLEATNIRLQEAEERLRAFEEVAQQRSPGGGSFLGGLFGSNSTTASPQHQLRPDDRPFK